MTAKWGESMVGEIFSLSPEGRRLMADRIKSSWRIKACRIYVQRLAHLYQLGPKGDYVP